jgi:hypothetical protein
LINKVRDLKKNLAAPVAPSLFTKEAKPRLDFVAALNQGIVSSINFEKNEFFLVKARIPKIS